MQGWDLSMKCVMLDTNFLLVPAKFKVDVFAELELLGYKPIVLSCVMSEVGKIASGRGKAGNEARIAQAIIELRKPRMIEARGPVDRALLARAAESSCAIATNEAALIARAKKQGITVLRLRQRKFVEEA